MICREGDILASQTTDEVALVLEVNPRDWGVETVLLRFGPDGPFVASYGDDWGLSSEWVQADG